MIKTNKKKIQHNFTYACSYELKGVLTFSNFFCPNIIHYFVIIEIIKHVLCCCCMKTAACANCCQLCM